jgi:hypothetical protein
MGYSTRQEVITALANALSSGNPVGGLGTVAPLTSIGNSITDTVPEAELQQYIRWADQNIDAAISSIYRVPLKRVNQGSFPLAIDATTGDTEAILADASRFTPGDVVVIRDSASSQQLTLSDVVGDEIQFSTTPLLTGYLAADTLVERIRYPEPIPKASARMAAAYLYDKHFSSQVEGNQSEFGKYLRKLAYGDLNQILAGTVKLEVPDASDLVGRRYYNPALDSIWGTLAEPSKEWFKTE